MKYNPELVAMLPRSLVKGAEQQLNCKFRQVVARESWRVPLTLIPFACASALAFASSIPVPLLGY
jgi:hypothetical protein